MRPLYSVIAVFFLISHVGFGQDEEFSDTYHKIGVKSGWLGLRFRDKVISDYLYTGGTIPLEFEYGFSNKKFRSNSSVIFNVKDSINTRTSMLKGFSYTANGLTFVDDTVGYLNQSTVQASYFRFDYSLARKLDFIHSEKFAFFLGGGFTFNSVNKKFLSLYYTNTISDRLYLVDFVAMAEYKLKSKHMFKYGINLPLGGRTHRVLHLEDSQHGSDNFKRWTFVNQSLAASNYLCYTFRLGEHFSLEGKYLFIFQRVIFPREELLVTQSILAGFNVHF